MESVNSIAFLMVGLGGFLGSVVRYSISLITHNGSWVSLLGMPLPTLIVNVLGSFVIGCGYSYFSHNGGLLSPSYLLLTVGFCGGFTTFSTFSLELMGMLREGMVLNALLYGSMAVLLSLIATFVGYYLIKYLL